MASAMRQTLSVKTPGGSMGGNPRTTFAKRQKERARQEKQAEKAQKRAQRKLQQDTPTSERPADLVISYDEEGQPQGFDFHDFQAGDSKE